MSGVEEFDREVKALVSRGKLSSSAVTSLSALAMANIRADSQLVSALYRHHRKASPANKLVSLYLIDAIAREAKSRQKKAERDGSRPPGPAAAAGSTTPSDSPPGAAAGPSAGEGDFASFLRKLEAVLSKIVLDNWENGLPEHREKVRKVLDIWMRASTFGASALAKIGSKLLAVSAVAAPVAQMSPGRPSLSPGPADTPPRDSTAPPAPAGIPANVLALLQAKAPPSQAALEQKQHDDVESEVERALREAREGTSLATHPVEAAASGPTSAPPPSSHAPTLGGGAAFGQTPQPYNGLKDAYASSSSGRSYPQGAPSASVYDADRSNSSRGVANGGYGSSSAPGPSASAAYGSSSHSPYHSGPPSHTRQYSAGERPGAGSRGDSDFWTASAYPTPDSYGGSSSSVSGPRGQTRSFDASQVADSGGYGRPEEPPTKRPYQQQQQRDASSSHASVGGVGGGYGSAGAPPPPPPGSASNLSGGSTPHQQPVPVASSTTGYPPDVVAAPPAPTPGEGGGGSPLDPTTFDATSPASWATFVNLLRTAHPYFVSLGRMPTMEEVMSLCAPSAMMAFGSGDAGVGGSGAGNLAAAPPPNAAMMMMMPGPGPGPGQGQGQAMMGGGGGRGPPAPY
ncbi:hypothetical protein JCM3774_001490 [Rhodotorula dairenensis]